MFACIEGIDASGKATQSKRLADWLGARLFSFPDYSTPMGRLIKGHLYQHWAAVPNGVREEKYPDLDPMVFQALQLSNRMEHAHEIARLLSLGLHVVADRYWPSGTVYGGCDGIDPDYLIRLHEFLPQPDLFLLMDMPTRLSAERRPDRRDRYEKDGHMEERAQRYRALWRQMAERQGRLRWVVIDASQSLEAVTVDVGRAVGALLKGGLTR